jgi:outer membrane biosynthesis protein TonB
MSSALDIARPAAVTRPRRYARWAGIALVSLLIHLCLIDALPHWTIEAADEPNTEPLRAKLMPLVPPVESPQPTPPPPRTPKPKTSTHPRAAPTPAVPSTETVQPFVPESTEPPIPVAVNAAPAPTPAAVEPPAAPPAPPPPATTPPQSARLDYKVISSNVKEANPIYGHGTITWAIADGRYATDLQAAANVFVFRFDVLASHSEGSVGAGGLAPDRYLESPRKRATVATSFNRDARQSISFSASAANVPLLAGTQDRLSVLFQIGALLLADPQKTAAGTEIEIPVAGTRGEVEQWRFDVRGNEAIDTGVGALSTTHLQRAPRPGTNDRTIDVWVAQSDGGYPARVLYTEPSGNTVMMTLDKISAMQ